MMGTLPQAEGWIGSKLSSSWGMPSGQQIQADRDAYATQHPYISGAANIAGGSVPYMAAGEALAPAGVLARALGMGATGAALNGGAAAVKGEDSSIPALAGAAAKLRDSRARAGRCQSIRKTVGDWLGRRIALSPSAPATRLITSL
jgi:hypothetical protein